MNVDTVILLNLLYILGNCYTTIIKYRCIKKGVIIVVFLSLLCVVNVPSVKCTPTDAICLSIYLSVHKDCNTAETTHHYVYSLISAPTLLYRMHQSSLSLPLQGDLIKAG